MEQNFQSVYVDQTEISLEPIPTTTHSAQAFTGTLARLLDLLELAARRGAFDLEEYQRVGSVYQEAIVCLPHKVG